MLMPLRALVLNVWKEDGEEVAHALRGSPRTHPLFMWALKEMPTLPCEQRCLALRHPRKLSPGPTLSCYHWSQGVHSS